MTKGQQNDVVLYEPGSLADIGAGHRAVLSGMVSDALTVARPRGRELSAARYRVGRYDLREPDYRQILLWSEALSLNPQAVIERLEATEMRTLAAHNTKIFETGRKIRASKVIPFAVEHGSIISLTWNLEALPIKQFNWIPGLSIQEFAIAWPYGPAYWEPKPPTRLSVRFPLTKLRRLHISYSNIINLDLDGANNLECLVCDNNAIECLNLSHTPNLRELSCECNNVVELDITKTFYLSHLRCSGNELRNLSIKNNHELKYLECSVNQFDVLIIENATRLETIECGESEKFTEVRLSNVPNLSSLSCMEAGLKELNVSNFQKLTKLNVESNQLTKLDLSGVPKLAYLWCEKNLLTELDVSQLPELTRLHCDGNPLTELDIRANSALVNLSCDPTVKVHKHPSEVF
jgi:hypothetical protein